MKDTEFFQLLVLVPHRDVRLLLRKWSAELFAAGLPGAWSFPWVAPLATLKRTLSTEELKALAKKMGTGDWGLGTRDSGLKVKLITNTLRQQTTLPSPQSLVPSPYSLFGTELNIALSDDFFEPVSEAIDCRFSQPVLGAALITHGGKAAPSFLINFDDLPPPPSISSRAAALANMSYQIKDDNFCEWKIGTLHWLPKLGTRERGLGTGERCS
ncbi:MAG: hypothetical protein FWD36_03675 [Treponema sp.]|nr:hypothetical protein [Treponema sp.]